MDDDKLQALFEKARAQGHSMARISRESGVPRTTCYRLREGVNEPLYSTRQRLVNALERITAE